MSLQFGTAAVSRVHHGGAEASRVYLGSTLVYQGFVPVTVFSWTGATRTYTPSYSPNWVYFDFDYAFPDTADEFEIRLNTFNCVLGDEQGFTGAAWNDLRGGGTPVPDGQSRATNDVQIFAGICTNHGPGTSLYGTIALAKTSAGKVRLLYGHQVDLDTGSFVQVG